MLTRALLLLFCAALPTWAETRFQARRMTREDVPAGKGQCDIRLHVDKEVEVSVHGDQVAIRTISGRDASDDGANAMPLCRTTTSWASSLKLWTAARGSAWWPNRHAATASPQ